MFRTWGLAAAGSVLALSASGCGDATDPQTATAQIGPSGGVITSIDSILTIAIRPGALEETTSLSIVRSDDAPRVFGPAYRISPNIELAVPATVTYRYELPEESTELNIGYVDPTEFESGQGRWRSLPVLRLSRSQNLVTATDSQLSLFYGLLDESIDLPPPTTGNTDSATGDADTGTTGPGDPTTNSPTTNDPTTDGPTGDSSDSTDTGIPIRCQDLPTGPLPTGEFAFDGSPLDGSSEDLTFTPNGTILVRNGADLVEIDPDGNVTVFNTSMPMPGDTLGTRWTVNNSFVTATLSTGEMLEVQADGTVSTLLTGLGIGNGIFADLDGNIFFTDFLGPPPLAAWVDANGANQVELGAGGDEAPQPNGIIYDPDRGFVFYVGYASGIIQRVDVSDLANPGTPETIAMIGSEGGGDQIGLDGVALDECGNLYIVDQNNDSEAVPIPGSLYRLRLDGAGNPVAEPELLVAEFAAGIANAVFAQGPGWEGYETTMFGVGLPGVIVTVDVGVVGAPTPVGG